MEKRVGQTVNWHRIILNSLMLVGVAVWADDLPAQSTRNRPETPTSPSIATQSAATDATKSESDLRFDIGKSGVVESLAQTDHAIRQRQTRQLWQDRLTSRESVLQALLHPDPEVAARARWILERWRLGITDATSPQIAAILDSDSDRTDRFGELLDLGQFHSISIALAESRGEPGWENDRLRTEYAIRQNFFRYVAIAHENETLPDFLETIEVVARSPAMLLTRLHLMRYLDLAINPQTLLPGSAMNWSADEIAKNSLLLWTALGDRSAAAKSCPDNDQDRFYLAAIMADGAAILQQSRPLWEASADQKPDEALENDNLRMLHFALQSSGAASPERQQIIATFSKSLSRLTEKQIADEDHESSPAVIADTEKLKKIAFALIQIGEISLAADATESTLPLQTIGLLRQSMRFEAAEELGNRYFDWDRLADAGVLQQKLTAALASQFNESSADDAAVVPIDSIQSTLDRIDFLLLTGRSDLGRLLALEFNDVMIEQERQNPAFEKVARGLQDELLTSLSVGTQRALILELIRRSNRMVSDAVLEHLAASITDGDRDAFDAVLSTLVSLLPKSDVNDRIAATLDLFSGVVPAGFDPDRDFERLLRLIQTQSTERTLRPYQLDSAAKLAIANLFRLHGQTPLANRVLAALAVQSDPRAMLQTGQRAMHDADVDTGILWFERLIADSLINPVSDELVFEAAALRLTAAHRRGLADDIDRWQRRCELMSMAPSSYVLSDLVPHAADPQTRRFLAEMIRARMAADYLDDPGGTYSMAVAYEKLMTRVFDDESNAGDEFNASGEINASDESDTGGRIAENQTSEQSVQRPAGRSAGQPHDLPIEPSHWYRLATLDFARIDADWWPYIAHQQAMRALAESIEKRDLAAAETTVDRLLRITPLDINLAELEVEQMRELGWNELATRTLQRVIDAGADHLSAFPCDVASSNNVAWVAAIGGVRLDDALRWSRRAVVAQPQSVIYRDTLAEVLYGLGRTAEAIQIERDCLLDTPDDWHVHGQIKKFSTPPDQAPPAT